MITPMQHAVALDILTRLNALPRSHQRAAFRVLKAGLDLAYLVATRQAVATLTPVGAEMLADTLDALTTWEREVAYGVAPGVVATLVA